MIINNLLAKIFRRKMVLQLRPMIQFTQYYSSASANSKPRYTATQPMLWDDFFQRDRHEEMTKEAFLRCIEAFRMSRGKRGGGQIEFIYAAMRNLHAYHVHRDLDIYKALLRVFPADGELIPKTMFQRIFWWYPQHQECAIKLLHEMEHNGVIPDKEVFDIMAERFGKFNFCTKKIARQMYWMTKLKYTNKYLDRRLVENKKLLDVELARIGLRMICRDAGTQITTFKAPFPDAPDRFNWVASAQSPLQKKLITGLPLGSTCYVDGPFRVWVREHSMHYIVLSAPPLLEADEEFIDTRTSHHVDTSEEFHKMLWQTGPKYNLHQQADQTILALGILGVFNQEYASVWLNHLHEENHRLTNISVLFRLKEIQKSVFRFQRDATGAG